VSDRRGAILTAFLDRFGQVVGQRWYKTSGGTDLDRFGYGYDANSHRLYKENEVSASHGDFGA
jgi:hypothetical protein